APDYAGVALDQLPEADPHRFLDRARAIHVARDLEQFGAFVLLAAEAGEPFGAAAENGRDDRDRFDVVDRGRAAVEACSGRERRLQPRLALLALEALEHRHLFAADVGAGAAVDEQVEVVARAARILAEQPGLVSLGNRA